MALNMVELCNRALIKIGADPINAFNDGTAESMVAGTLYTAVRDALLSAHPWSFATAQKHLVRLIGQPVADFSYAYQLPDDFLRALSAGQGGAGRGVHYRIIEKRVHTNAASLTLTYIFRPGESAFPPFFDQALIARLAADFCLPLTESTSRAETLYRMAEEELKRTRLIDAQQDFPNRFEDFSLVGVRG